MRPFPGMLTDFYHCGVVDHIGYLSENSKKTLGINLLNIENKCGGNAFKNYGAQHPYLTDSITTKTLLYYIIFHICSRFSSMSPLKQVHAAKS